MSNLETLRKLTLGKEDTEKVIIEYENENHEFTIRPLTDGELTKLQSMEKQSLVLKVGMQNGKRETVRTNMQDVDINTGEFTGDQSEALYAAVSLSLTIDDEEPVTIDDVKALPTGLPGILFKEVIRISKLSETDLTIIKSFQ